MSKTFSIYEAKARLSELIRLVKKGAEPIITERGVPVARVIPFGNKEITLDDRLQSLEKSGLLTNRITQNDFPDSLESSSGALKRFLAERE